MNAMQMPQLRWPDELPGWVFVLVLVAVLGLVLWRGALAVFEVRYRRSTPHERLAAGLTWVFVAGTLCLVVGLLVS